MASSQALEFMTINSVKKHTASLIFLHGLGDSSRGWSSVFNMLSRNPKLQHIKFILPNAPSQPVTLNRGMRMPSWFDIRSLDEEGMLEEGGEDQEGMLQSGLGVTTLIGKEVDAGIEGNRIIVGGFSQGGAIGLLTGLTSERRLGGIISLSSWLPMNKKMPSVC
jgi:predicted esterase